MPPTTGYLGQWTKNQMKRYGMVIALNEDRMEDYKRLHEAVWPEVLNRIEICNIRNFSIYLHKLDDAGHFLFSYFEYIGEDFEADMAKMADDSITRKWWEECNPCQRPLENRSGDEWWANMSEIFHCD